jgi:peroxin-1
MAIFQDKARNACGYGPIALMASAQSLQSLPQDLTSSGHFLFVLLFSLLVSH